MTAIGGSVEAVSWYGREFAVAADAEGQKDLGGYSKEFRSNGNATGRLIMTRKGWALDGLSLSIDADNEDLEFLQGRVDAKGYGEFTATFAGGDTWQGTATLTGELKASTQNATAPVKFEGPGKLTKQ